MRTDFPKPDVCRVLAPYSGRMKKPPEDAPSYYRPKLRPNGHDLSRCFANCSPTSEPGCAPVKLAATRVRVPPVELDCSRPKAWSGKKPRGPTRKQDQD